MITITHSETLVGRKLAVQLAATDDVVLYTNALDVSISWGDGTAVQVISGFSPFESAVYHTFQADGLYLIQVTAKNHRAPTPDASTVSIPLTIRTRPPIQLSTQVSNGFIFGPIIPLQRRFPNQDQWCFNIGSDLQVLESNVTLLALTSYGERLMNPTYGTGLRQLIFEKDLQFVETVGKEQLSIAVNQFEPRVNVESVTVKSLSDTSAMITLQISPKDNLGQAIEISSTLSQ